MLFPLYEAVVALRPVTQLQLMLMSRWPSFLRQQAYGHHSQQVRFRSQTATSCAPLVVFCAAARLLLHPHARL